MIRRPPRSTRTDTLFPYTTLFRSRIDHLLALVGQLRRRLVLPRLDLTDFAGAQVVPVDGAAVAILHAVDQRRHDALAAVHHHGIGGGHLHERGLAGAERHRQHRVQVGDDAKAPRSEEHTSELQSLMRISYAVFCLKKKKTKKTKR